MPNQNSHAHHKPQRTCVVCRSRKDSSELLNFVLLPEGVVFDPGRKLQRRNHYLCPEPKCIDGLIKWKGRYRKRRGGG
jgi:predicted RNA-binding protein YlxR (DUF448 family)